MEKHIELLLTYVSKTDIVDMDDDFCICIKGASIRSAELLLCMLDCTRYVDYRGVVYYDKDDLDALAIIESFEGRVMYLYIDDLAVVIRRMGGV